MVNNIAEYLNETYPDVVETIIGQQFMREVKYQAKKSMKLRQETIGDIDLQVICEDSEVPLVKVLPASSLWNPRPPEDQTFFHADLEIKRSANPDNIKEKVEQFVNFYSEVYELFADFDEGEPVLFVYNNVENKRAVAEMKKALGLRKNAPDEKMEIRGHPVYVVWTDSDKVASRLSDERVQQLEKKAAERDRKDAAREKAIRKRLRDEGVPEDVIAKAMKK
jgi:hypothetical protein